MQQVIWYFNAGGILMWPLLACSVIAVAAIVERLIRLRRGILIDEATIDSLQKQLETGQVQSAIDRNASSPFLSGRIIARALEEHQKHGAPIDQALIESGERGLQTLANNIGLLVLISKVAPLLGLLGTVLGMIQGFEALEAAGVGKAQLAGAIRIALITTAAGLMVAIPCVVAVAFFRARLRRLQAEFEEILLAVARSVKQGAARQAPPPAAPQPADDDRLVLPPMLA